jgi:hypothetical protein
MKQLAFKRITFVRSLKRALLIFSCFLLVATQIPAATVPSQTLLLPGDSTRLRLPAKMTAVDFKKITGRKPKFKERIGLFLYNHKLLKPKPNGDAKKGRRLGRISLFAALGGWLLLLSGAGVLMVIGGVALVTSFTVGILALQEKKGDASAAIGIVLSSLFMLFFFIYVIIDAFDRLFGGSLSFGG